MHRSIRKFARVRQLVRSSVLVMVLSVAALAVLSSSVAHAEEPPGDCWGEVLSDDPLHCYALEEAHREGVIEVEGVYDDGNGALYIFFNYLRPVEDRVYTELMEYLPLEEAHS